MKEKSSNNRSIIIIILGLLAVLIIGFTAAVVYASRFVGQGIGSIFSQGIEAPLDMPATLLEDNPVSSIYDQGVLVVGVEPDSPAATVGIRRGTIILSVNGEEINDAKSLQDLLTNAGSGSIVTLSIINSPKPEDITVALAEEPPYLGVRLEGGGQQLRFGPGGELGLPNDAMMSGVVIGEIVKDSAAESSGLLVGDIIESIDGEAVADVDSLVAILSAKSPGETITVGIQRGGETQEIMVTLGAHPEDETVGFLGIKPSNLMLGQGRLKENDGSGQFSMPFQLPFDENMATSGALIVTVAPDSPAFTAGLEKGDVVTGFDGQAIGNVDDLILAVSGRKPGDSVTISILRNNETVDLQATLGENPDVNEKAYLGVELGAFYNLDPNALPDGTLPEDFSFHMNPDFNWDEFFANPENFSDFLPHFGDKIAPNIAEQDA